MHQEGFSKFESLKTVVNHGVEYWSARDIMPSLGYIQWRNFAGVIERAIGIIKHKHLKGKIVKTSAIVEIGSGAKREIIDYLIDIDGLSLLNELCSSYKLNNFYSIRNETVVLQMVEKYCRKKEISFEYPYPAGAYIFDCMVADNILIEFDEPHHQNDTRQKNVDNKKNRFAVDNGFGLYRVTVEMDIVDVIVYLESMT